MLLKVAQFLELSTLFVEQPVMKLLSASIVLLAITLAILGRREVVVLPNDDDYPSLIFINRFSGHVDHCYIAFAPISPNMICVSLSN